jgi:outer membrane protein assembly factor BamB
MRNICLSLAASAAIIVSSGFAQPAGPYKVLKTVKTGSTGGFDYVNADSDGRRLYVARTGPTPRVNVFDLDTLAATGEIPETSAHGVAIDPKTGHGFASSKPIVMFDTKTLKVIKKIDVDGGPDGLLFDPFNLRVWVLSHRAPNVTVLDTKDGSIVGTVDLGGAPEQAATDGNGHVYIDIEDKDNVAVVDAKTLTVTAHYELGGKGGTPAGLALDAKNGVLFVACRKPATMVMLAAKDGKVLDALPIGAGSDGAVFNPATLEAFSSQGDGTLTIIKEKSPTSFEVKQTVQTPVRAKTLTLDGKTGNILLITAEFAAPPAPAAGDPPAPAGRPARGAMVPDSFSIVVVGK